MFGKESASETLSIERSKKCIRLREPLVNNQRFFIYVFVYDNCWPGASSRGLFQGVFSGRFISVSCFLNVISMCGYGRIAQVVRARH